MKAEDFDDSIRQKLSQISSGNTSDADVDKVHRYVKHNMQVPFYKGVYMKAAIYILGISVVGLVAWNIIQMNEQQKMSETISTLENKLKKSQTSPDTVYMKESTPVLSNDPSNSMTQNSSTKTKNTIPSNSQKNDLNYTPIKNNNNKTNIHKPSKEKTTDNLANNNIKNPEEKMSPDKLKELPQEEIPSPDNTDKKEKTISPDTAQNTIDTAASPPPNSIRPKNKNNHSKQYILAGLGFESSFHMNGYGAYMEYGFAKNFSVGLGFKTIIHHPEMYRDNRDFRDHRGHNLNQEFGNQLPPDTHNVHDIKVNNVIYTMPLQLTGYVPVKNTRIKIAFSAGTDMNIYSHQGVEYMYRMPGNREEEKNFVSTAPIPLFNNIVAAAGIDCQWKNFNVQASAYFRKLYPSMPMRRDEDNFGIRLRVLYRFMI